MAVVLSDSGLPAVAAPWGHPRGLAMGWAGHASLVSETAEGETGMDG